MGLNIILTIVWIFIGVIILGDLLFEIIRLTRIKGDVKETKLYRVIKYGWFWVSNGQGYYNSNLGVFYTSKHNVYDKVFFGGKFHVPVEFCYDMVFIGDKSGIVMINGERVYHYFYDNGPVKVEVRLEERVFRGQLYWVALCDRVKGRSGSVFMNVYGQVFGVYGVCIENVGDKGYFLVQEKHRKIDKVVEMSASEFEERKACYWKVYSDVNFSPRVMDRFKQNKIVLNASTGGGKTALVCHYVSSDTSKYVIVVSSKELAINVCDYIRKDLKYYGVSKTVEWFCYKSEKNVGADIIVLLRNNFVYWSIMLNLTNRRFFFDEWDLYKSVVEEFIKYSGLEKYFLISATTEPKPISDIVLNSENKFITCKFGVEFNIEELKNRGKVLVYVPSRDFANLLGYEVTETLPDGNSVKDGIWFVTEKNRRGINFNSDVIYDFGLVVRFKVNNDVVFPSNKNIDLGLLEQTIGRNNRFGDDKRRYYYCRLSEKNVSHFLGDEEVESYSLCIKRTKLKKNISIFRGVYPYLTLVNCMDYDGLMTLKLDLSNIEYGKVKTGYEINGEVTCFSNSDLKLTKFLKYGDKFRVESGKVLFFFRKRFYLMGILFAKLVVVRKFSRDME